MAPWDFQRSVTSLRLMAELAVELGLPMEAALAGSDLEQRQLAEPGLVVSARQELQVIRNLVTHAGARPALGILAGQRYHFTAFGALGFAIVSSRTLRQALDVGLQYFQLTFAFTRLVVTDEGDETAILLEDDAVPADLARFIVERDLAALITLARDLYNLSPALNLVSFKQDAPADQSAHAAFFQLPPLFNAPVNSVRFDHAMFTQPLPRANELAQSAALDQCRQLLEARKARHGLAALVRSHLLTAGAALPTMNAVADTLCMTPRTLRRRLDNEGVTFAELREEVRMTLADEFLSGPRLSIQQIAELLGYAETTSFINAFKRWHGQTPHAFRLRRGA